MRDHSHWSINLGRWGGVQVQLHLFFLLFAALTLYLCWLESRPGKVAEAPVGMAAPAGMAATASKNAPGEAKSPVPAASQDRGPAVGPRDVKPSIDNAPAKEAPAKETQSGKTAANGRRDGASDSSVIAPPTVSMTAVALISLAVLFCSVLVHELGRRQAAIRVGGTHDHFVLWPLGGLGVVRAPADPRAEVLIHLSGPAANLATAAICLLPLLVARTSGFPGLMNPLLPTGVTEGGWPAVTLKLGFWINWVLFLVNLIPAFPFDGGRALRAAVLIHWPDLDRRAAAVVVARLATVAAVLMLVAAWLVWRRPSESQAAPAWFALLVLAIFLYFGGKQEVDRRDEDHDDDEHPFGYDFSAGYTSLEKTARPAAPKRKPGVIAQWRKKRREERLKRQAEVEAADELRVDEILTRLHEQGKDSLSEEDRAVLARVSARYRGRSENQA